MKKVIINSIKAAAFGAALFGFALSAGAQTWTAPTTTPPGGNVAAPINVGTTTQVKQGGLAVGYATTPLVNYPFISYGTSSLVEHTEIGWDCPYDNGGSAVGCPVTGGGAGIGGGTGAGGTASGSLPQYFGMAKSSSLVSDILNVFSPSVAEASGSGVGTVAGDILHVFGNISFVTPTGGFIVNGSTVCTSSGSGCPSSTSQWTTSGANIHNSNTGYVATTGALQVGTSAQIGTSMNIDNGNANSGSLTNGLTFGNGSGEGIASKRTSGGNQYGLDFYTDYLDRMSITNAGNVNIGTSSALPGEGALAALNVNGAIDANGEAHFANGTYADPKPGDVAAIKATSIDTGHLYVVNEPAIYLVKTSTGCSNEADTAGGAFISPATGAMHYDEVTTHPYCWSSGLGYNPNTLIGYLIPADGTPSGGGTGGGTPFTLATPAVSGISTSSSPGPNEFTLNDTVYGGPAISGHFVIHNIISGTYLDGSGTTGIPATLTGTPAGSNLHLVVPDAACSPSSGADVYTVSAYATNASGTVYSAPMSFETIPC